MRRAASNAPAQLVQLRKAEALCVLDHHERRVGDVHAHLDHGRSHQQVDPACQESGHGLRLLGGFQAPVNQSHLESRKLLAQRSVGIERRLQLQLFGLLDQGTHPVRLAPGCASLADASHDFRAA